MRYLTIVLFAALFMQCKESTESQKKVQIDYFTLEKNKKLNFPFSDAVRVGNKLYLSGVIANLPGTKKLVDGGIDAESKQVMENIGLVLNAFNLSYEDICKCTIMLDNITDWPKFNTIYAAYFKKNKPARSAFATTGLALGAKVEVECIAVLP